MTLSPEMVTSTRTDSVLESKLSIIIPVYNQQSKVSYSIQRIKESIESSFSNYELIVSNDGSSDDTLAVLRDIAEKDEHIRIISYTPNRGKGYAVKQGILHSCGEVVIFLDGDLDISPDSIKEYVEQLDNNDLVIASKRHPESNVTIPRSRALLSTGFHFLIKMATGISQRDTQAGFKVGNGDIMRAIFRNISINRYAFDVELLTIASILHLRVQEMPVIMKIDRRFKMKEIMKMFVDVTRIWYKYKISHAYQHMDVRKTIVLNK
jgi:dolichol-phosphate mannosyltransferase